MLPFWPCIKPRPLGHTTPKVYYWWTAIVLNPYKISHVALLKEEANTRIAAAVQFLPKVTGLPNMEKNPCGYPMYN